MYFAFTGAFVKVSLREGEASSNKNHKQNKTLAAQSGGHVLNIMIPVPVA
jgi:hypothetical protein